MRPGNVVVEQVDKFGHIVHDFGEILTPQEMRSAALQHFPNSYELGSEVFGEINGKKYALYLKNISYLGNPHSINKKRIQIPGSFREVYRCNKAQGIETLLIGVYYYNGHTMFCDFNTSQYLSNTLNNSSAHVHTLDLQYGTTQGIFSKTDMKGNRVSVCTPDKVKQMLAERLFETPQTQLGFVTVFDDFFSTLQPQWFGIDCYKEMWKAQFTNANQAEWPGFYLEYKFGDFSQKNDISNIVCMDADKVAGGIDLDLYFPREECYGDLKAHSSGSSGIPGNDFMTVERVLDTGKLYYVVCFHDTQKDKEFDFEVTRYWNHKLNKTNPLSYGTRMKHSIQLKRYAILEINQYNKVHLSAFNQGRNSGKGDVRAPKIMINKREIDTFLIHTKRLGN